MIDAKRTSNRLSSDNAVTKSSSIALNVLVVNLEQLEELLFVFFAALLRFLVVN